MNVIKSKRNKLNPIFLLILFTLINISNGVSVEIGKSIVPNQCSSLGENNPLRLIDCSIFKLKKGMCCLLTITNKIQKLDNEGVKYFEEVYDTACIVLEKIDAQVINTTTIQYKSLGDDVLIECSQFYLNSFINLFYLLFIFILWTKYNFLELSFFI